MWSPGRNAARFSRRKFIKVHSFDQATATTLYNCDKSETVNFYNQIINKTFTLIDVAMSHQLKYTIKIIWIILACKEIVICSPNIC